MSELTLNTKEKLRRSLNNRHDTIMIEGKIADWIYNSKFNLQSPIAAIIPHLIAYVIAWSIGGFNFFFPMVICSITYEFSAIMISIMVGPRLMNSLWKEYKISNYEKKMLLLRKRGF